MKAYPAIDGELLHARSLGAGAAHSREQSRGLAQKHATSGHNARQHGCRFEAANKVGGGERMRQREAKRSSVWGVPVNVLLSLHTQTQTHRHTNTHRHRHRHRHTQTHTQTDTHRQTHTDTDTDTHTHTHTLSLSCLAHSLTLGWSMGEEESKTEGKVMLRCDLLQDSKVWRIAEWSRK